MMKKSIVHIIIIFVFSVSQFYVSSQTVEQLKKERKQIQKKLEQTSKILRETKNNEKQSIKKLNVLKQGVIERKALINNYNSEINILENKITRLSSEQSSLEKELEKLKKDYTRLIQKAQINKNVYSKLMFVLSADNFDQGIRRMRYLHEFTDYEKQQGNKIKEIQKILGQKTDSLGQHKLSKVQAVKAKEIETTKLQKDQKNEQIVLTDLQKKEKNLSSEYQKNQRKVNEINANIERIIAEEIRKAEARKRAEEARKKAAEEAHKKALEEQRRKETEKLKETAKSTKTTKTSTKTSANTSSEVAVKEEKEPTLPSYEISKETREENLLSGNFERNRGRLPWPVERGSVSGHFGIHPHPFLSHVTVNNKGTYFQSPSGTNARAVYDGIVTVVFSIQGTQNIIIQHGNYRTVYGNLSNVYVRQGQKVNAKQAIGKIYSDDESGKTELYFQIRLGKQVLNPEGWIAR